MRGTDHQQSTMFSYVSPDDRVPAQHPLRAIREMTDEALKELSPRFDAMYSREGRPSIAPEKLLRALLLQGLYSVRSERLLRRSCSTGSTRRRPGIPPRPASSFSGPARYAIARPTGGGLRVGRDSVSTPGDIAPRRGCGFLYALVRPPSQCAFEPIQERPPAGSSKLGPSSDGPVGRWQAGPADLEAPAERSSSQWPMPFQNCAAPA